MHRTIAALAIAASLLAIGTSAIHAQAAGQIRKFSGGWNLISAPPGTNLSIVNALYTAQPNDQGYEQSQPVDGTVGGYGYWAYVTSVDMSGYSRSVQLGAGTSAPYTVSVPAGQWVMVGNPSGMLMASVQGADVAYTFDPTNGFQPSTLLQPGQGAWVGSTSGAVVTINPIQPAANAQAAYNTMQAVPPAPAGPSAQPASQVSVTVTSTAPNPVIPNPNTSYEPVPSWTYWPYPLTTNWAPPGPSFTSSAPYANQVACNGYIVTGWALDSCGTLLGQPGPSAP